MYKIICEDVEFIGYENDCWKFIVGFLGFDMCNRYSILDILDFDGTYSHRGLISVFEVN